MSYNVFTSCKPIDSSNKKGSSGIWNLNFAAIQPVISHNIVENITYDYYYIIIYTDLPLILENNTFQNLHLGGQYGGGLACWLSPSIGQSQYEVTFKDCHFYNNEVIRCSKPVTTYDKLQGGAFQHGWTQSTANCLLTFDGCDFISNSAAEEGGALALQTNRNIIIQYCIFENNKGSKGGAIYIFPDYPVNLSKRQIQEKITISSCQFKSNIATDGNAIYVDEGSSTTLEISKCNLTDNNINTESNSLGYCIVSGCKSTIINEFDVYINSTEKITGALYINGRSSISITNFNINGKLDQAIKLDNTLNLNHTWNININDTIFTSDRNEVTTILLEDSDTEISNIILNNDRFLGSLLKLDISGSSITLESFYITSCSTFNGQILDLPNTYSDGIKIINTLIHKCSAKSLLSIDSNINIENCNFTENTVYSNGTISVHPSQKLTLSNCKFDKNKANTETNDQYVGGAIYISSSETDDTEVIIERSSFKNNDAFDGTAIYSDDTKAHVVIRENTIFSYDDSSKDTKYMIVLQNSNLEISDVSFTCNYPISFYNVNKVQDIEFRNVISTKKPILQLTNEHSYGIDSIAFYNCKAKDYLVQSDVELLISNSHFEFSELTDSKSCGCIIIKQYGDHKITSTNFIKAYKHSIHYQLGNTNQASDKTITISDCTFDNCNGKGTDRIFSIAIPHRIVFENNTIQNTQLANYGGAIQFNNIEDITLDNCKFINNSMSNPDSDHYSGGCGLWICREEKRTSGTFTYREYLKITYSNCLWQNNSVNKQYGGGALQVGYSTLSNIELVFTKCRFDQNEAKRGNGGALSIQTIQPLTIIDCEFTSNYASSTDAFGGAIYINPNFAGKSKSLSMTYCDIINCTFEGNYAPTENGLVICMEGGVDTNLSIYSNNTFKNNNHNEGSGSAILYKGQNLYLEFPQFSDSFKSRFIEFGEESRVDLYDVEFKDCYEKNGEGNAIKISETATSIALTDCTFTDCGDSGFVIQDLGALVSFTNCVFTFTESSRGCCALDITTSLTCNIVECQFINNNNNNENDEKSAPLYYHPTAPEGSIIIRSCLFDNCKSADTNKYKTFSIQSQRELIFSSNTVQNMGDAEHPNGYIGEIVISNDEQTIERCNFNHIVSSSQFGGGSGIKIVRDELVNSFSLNYISCEWYDNRAIHSIDHGNNRYNGVGGAFQQGINPSFSSTALLFDNCTFIRNKSDREGGALAIQTIKIVNIINCFFKENKAGLNIQESSTKATLLALPENVGCGGAIYIDPDFLNEQDLPEFMPSFNILHSTFILNEAVNGHAIYIRGGRRTYFNIENETIFTDNGKSGCTILCESNNLYVATDTIFNFTNSSEASRPTDYTGPDVEAKYENLIFEDVSGTTNQSEGNVIHIPPGIKSAEIINCSFTNCGKQGWVITCYSAPIHFLNNTITFTDPLTAIKGLGIWAKGRINVKDSIFQRCNCYEINNTAGGLLIQPPNPSESVSNYLEFFNNTFEEMHGRNQRCFAITWWDSHFTSRDISIIRSPESNHTAAIYLISTTTIMHRFERWSFINNTANAMFGGGCGIWVADYNKRQQLQLTFDSCIWYGNRAVHSKGQGEDPAGREYAYNGLGGAYQQGFSETNVNAILQFYKCLFENNHADLEGGALAIQTVQDCKIENCTFSQNSAGNRPDIKYSTRSGGAIFIDPDFVNPIVSSYRKPTTTIYGCTFDNNSAINGHAISITGNDASLIINDNNFTDNGNNENSEIYSICAEFKIANNVFIRIRGSSDPDIKSRAIELAVKSEITIDNNIFENYYSLENGGAILFNPPIEQSTLLASDQEYSIVNSKFINCRAANGGSIYISSNVNTVKITNTIFDGGSVNKGEGVALYIDRNVALFEIDSSVEFINQNCISKFLIHSSANKFNIENFRINNNELGSGIKGIQLNAGDVTINNIYFHQCTVGIEINQGVNSATVQNCIFSDCYFDKGNQPSGQVVSISNTNCIFTHNIINFTDSSKAIAGILVENHGNIDISYNHFFRTRNTNGNNGGSILIKDGAANLEGTLLFNYNTIEETFNNKFSAFYIAKKNPFNFDHNLIKNCKINNYMCNMDLRGNTQFNHEFTFNNLTLLGCESHSQTGGGFGIWLVFDNINNVKDGKASFIGCRFEGNTAGIVDSKVGGCGGGFECGGASTARTELMFVNCDFLANKAERYGGGLAILSTKEALITNCRFERNEAQNGGGAVYVYPNKTDSLTLPKCTISRCIFKSNIDKSKNNGDAILFREFSGSTTTFIVDQECSFTDNGDINNNAFKGYTIVSAAPNFQFKDSTIQFTNIDRATPALKLENSGSSEVTNVKFIQANSAIWYDQNRDYEAMAVLITPTANRAEFENCTFDHCGTWGGKCAIYDEGKETIVNNCQFLSDYIGSNSFGVIYIKSIGIHTITNIFAQNCWADNGIFQYKPETETNSERKFTFENITIDKVRGNDRMALNFNIQKADILFIRNITVQNNNQNPDYKNCIVGIELNQDVSEFVFNDFKFIKNTVRQNFIGGSGIWIKINNPGTNIIFNDCRFEENKAEYNDDPSRLSGYGGAWSVGLHTEIREINVIMTGCHFIRNHAEKSGGALCLVPNGNVTIEDCNFEGNHANDNGGAIYIDSNYEVSPDKFAITGCRFSNNYASYDSSFYFQTSEETLIEVDDCSFNNNVAGKNIVYSTAGNLIVHDLDFEFSNTNANARPLCLGTNSKTEIYNVQFIKCSMNNEEGTAIKGEPGMKSLNVHDSKFQDCKDIGSSVYILGSSTNENTIINFNAVVFVCTGTATASGLNIQNCGYHIEVIDCSFTNMKYQKTKDDNNKDYHISPLNLVSNSYGEDFVFTGLTFTNCYGSNLRCFSLNANKPFTFSNVTVKDNTLGNYLGQINFNGAASSSDVFVFDNCKWLNNHCNSAFGGGAGLWLINNRKECIFAFENCLFEGNSHTNKGGAFQDGDSNTVKTKSLRFINCTFNNNEAGNSGGALAIETVLPFIVDGCKFNDNTAKGKEENGGGAIFVNTVDETSGSITNCVFVSNKATNSGMGTVLMSLGPLVTLTFDGSNTVTNKGERGSVICSSCGNLVVNNVLFDFNPTNANTKRNFRAAHLLNKSSSSFTNCRFIGTGYTDNPPGGHAILAEAGTIKVSFNNCNFTDCGNHASHYAIVSNAEQFEFMYSQFTCTNPDVCCAAIRINKRSKLSVYDSLFKDIHASEPEFGSGIAYPGNSGDVNNCNVEIVRTTFDNLGGRNGRAGFFKLARHALISNCTIKNMPDGSYILTIGHEKNPQGQAILDRVIFVDNKANCNDGAGGGGIGLWLSQTSKYTLQECQFIRNTNTGKYHGGALGYSQDQSKSNSKVGLEFRECLFQDNKVQPDFNGGSLYIDARVEPVDIISCVFSNTINDAAARGGAIYISGNTTQTVTIRDTEFRNMKVKQTSNDCGNALYIEKGAQNTVIQNCKFIDCCGQGSSICTNGRNVIFEGSNITFTSTPQQCKGIFIQAKCHIELIDSVISNCNSNSNGGGFSYRANKIDSEQTENLVFRNTIFDNCESNNGRAIFATAASSNTEFFNLTIQHIKRNNGFILTLGHDSVIQQPVKFEQCNFIDCKTNIQDGDGGGLGFWCSDEIGIEFNNCLFRELAAGSNGGAISFTQSDKRRDTKLTFFKCLFDQNKANINGSALYIDIRAKLLIDQCNFTSNYGNGDKFGGAIFITQRCRNINIERTEFYSNTQSTQSSSHGNAIYFENQRNLVGYIYNCKFVDCGTRGSVVYSDGVALEFIFNIVSFTQPEQGAKGLHVPKSCNIHVANSTFKGCVSGSEGAGFVFDGRNDKTDPGLITIENTIFENNNATNGCAVYAWANVNPIIREVTIRGHKKGTFIFSLFLNNSPEEDAVLEGCIFENNFFNTKSAQQPDGGGAGIWIAEARSSTTPVTFLDCTFRENYATQFGGAMAYGDSNTLKLVELTYQGCTFSKNVAGNCGGALWINSESLIVIDDCEFISNTANNEETSGNAIILKERAKVIITDSTLVNNGVKGSAIVFEGKSINAIDTSIEFDLFTESSRGIEFRNKATIELEGVTFLRCNARSANRGEGGGIFYHEAIPNNDELIFTLDSCIFDANDALNGSALLLNISSVPDIYGCTFRNHQSGSYIFSIVFSMFQMVFEFSDCKFENNYHETSADHEDGGGSGIWIANNKQIAAGRLMQIYFTSIKFTNNVSPCVGGAFAYGRSPTVYPSELYFDGCDFTGNTAETDGGALWIITKSPYEIQYCNFKNNVARGRGGSIMVDTKAPIATIQTSSFEIETAGTDGNSIYVTDKTPRFILSGNNFVDCGMINNVITIDTTIAGLDGNTIQFTNQDETCRGLNLKSAGTFDIADNKFYLCSAERGGAIMFRDQNKKGGNETLIFSGNTIDSCIATNTGCAMYLEVNVPPTFSDNTITNCRNGNRVVTIVFKIEISQYILNGFTFENNEYHNLRNNEDCGGSGFWVENANSRPFNFIFRSVTWKDNTAVYCGGAFAYGRTAAYRGNNLLFESCTFNNNRCKEELGGALWISTTGKVEIDNCNFVNNKALGVNSYGGAIYFDQQCTATVSITNTNMSKNSAIDANAIYLPTSLNEVHIDSSTLINNGNLNSTIRSVCPVLLIENSFIGFDKYSLKCKGIEIYTNCNITIRSCNISNCDATEASGDLTNIYDSRAHGGGIHYRVDSVTRSARSNEENIVIEDVIFTNCKGNNGAACMICPITPNIVFNRNTIQDCRCGKYIFCIIASNYIENFTIEDCTFKHNLMNNRENSEDGGGSGIWIANDKDKVVIPEGRNPHIFFKNCHWLENQASASGGALAYGRSPTLVKTEITFESCKFTDNVAKNREGGALWIATSVPFLIDDCTFLRNTAKGDSSQGGAITVASKSPQINIKNTRFLSNEAREGNAIYVKQTTNDMNITDCTFQNNGVYGSVIANEAKQICIDTCYIQFDSTTKSCRGINFLSRSYALIRDTHFVNCKTTESRGGGGLLYQNTLNTVDEESLTIEGCLFNNCEGSNGCALLAWLETPIILRNNLIWHSTNNKYIVSVFYNKYVNETIVEDCYFEHNSFYNDDTNRDGGGSGIWIAHAGGLVPKEEFQKLTFVGCTWRNNTADAYGGAFSYGKSGTVKGIELEFRDSIFINNTARKTYGGALYIITEKPLTISDCFFDGNKAGGIGGAVYFSKFGDVSITDSKFARNKAYEAGAVCCDGRNKVNLDSLVFSENTADIDSPSLLIRHYGDSPFNVKNCKFDFEKIIGQSQIVVRNNNYENSKQTVNFYGCCFTHQGDAIDTVTHIKVDLVSGAINFDSENCFDTPEELAITSRNNETEITTADGIFDCHTCVVPSIPTSPPTNMPSQSPSPTPVATPRPTDDLPEPTPRPTVDQPSTSIPTRSQAQTATKAPTSIPTGGEQTPSSQPSTEATPDTGNVVSKDKSKAKKIGMIAGIAAAGVVIIVVVIILIWLFVCRNRQPKDDGYKGNRNDNEASEEADSTPAAALDDPIWSYQSQDNPLYNDNDHNDDDNAFDDDDNFEESWGNTI